MYLTWKGSKGDTLKSILLNSHIDVVPVDEVHKSFIITFIIYHLVAQNHLEILCMLLIIIIYVHVALCIEQMDV